MSSKGDFGRRLRESRVPGEEEAEERSWEIVSSAYAARMPIRSAARRRRRLALAFAGGALLVAFGLSPAGAKVSDLVGDVVGIGEEDARPALRSLPAAGEVVVEAEGGVWIVREDGSKRLLGDYDEGTWSPHGLFVAVAEGHDLIVVDPLGEVRWTITAPGAVRDPRWSPSGFRIAYRSEGDLRVVAGDGTGDRLLASGVAPIPPAWRPIGSSKLAGGGAGTHLLSYIEADTRTVRTVDVDTGARVKTLPADLALLPSHPAGERMGRAIAPDGKRLAFVRQRGRRAELLLASADGRPRVLFSDPTRMTAPTWSPDGHWLLVGLPRADQWVFIRTDRPGRLIAFDRMSEQFDPGGSGNPVFPAVGGWVLPQR